MSQRKNRRWWGLRAKTFVGLFVAFIFGCLALTYSVSNQINNRNETQIKKDIGILRNSTTVYVRQTLMLNSANNDEVSFQELATNIISDLYGAGMRHVALYDSKGNLLMASRNSLFATGNMADLVKAVEGYASYTIVRDNKDQLIVWFSMPVSVAEERIGIVRYYLDYTDLLADGKENAFTILQIAILIFIMTFLIVIVMIRRLLSPIQQLAGLSNQVADDLKKDKFDEKRYLFLTQSSRKDELGDLNNNYRIMLQTVQNQLEKLQSDKNQIYELMKSRKEFYDNVTHELKTPLTTINGYAQLLQDNGAEDKELFQKGIQNIMEESVRLHRMVIQLLEMSNGEQYKNWETIDLVSELRDVSEAMELKAKRYGSHIEFGEIKAVKITAIKDRVREVFVNVIDNAIKYGMNPQTIQISLSKKKNWVEIIISNEGKSITKEEAAHIFEPFYRINKQLSREQGSAGLGLSICMQIMKEHQGDINVASNNGRISFIIQFPMKHGNE